MLAEVQTPESMRELTAEQVSAVFCQDWKIEKGASAVLVETVWRQFVVGLWLRADLMEEFGARLIR